MFYLKIGMRNIIKNFKRSLLTMISIIIGIMSCLLTQGFFNWNSNELKESMIHTGIGHYQLTAKGFIKSGNDDPYRYLIVNTEPILKELRAIPEVDCVTTRMGYNGILASGEKSTVTMGSAVNPEFEVKLAPFSGIIMGTNLSVSKPNGIILGEGLAKKISVKLKDTVTLMLNMKGGGINAADFEVTGITRTGYPEVDNISSTAELGLIQNTVAIDQSVQKIVLLLKKTSDTEKVLPKIKAIAVKYHLEYRNWEDLAEFYHSVKLLYQVIFIIIILIVLMIVIFTISNTVNMNLYDRIREIGTIRALGTKRNQVAKIFIAESSLLGILGGVIGLALTYLYIGFIEIIGGLPITIGEGSAREVMHVYFHPDAVSVIVCLVLFTLIAVGASINPSRRASQLSITDALRWI